MDIQDDFFNGHLKIKRVKKIVEALQRLAVPAHKTKDIKGTHGEEVISELAPDPAKNYVGSAYTAVSTIQA